ncbi:hypothetical protein F0562_006609 [Nyssa sinensis]|uniref:Uncharacterized protein n=1 Tax=Nyssa sinensis TaxID=561372 RepID=A0A5J5AMZ2_9ASTE|nr:hypothetical protein F0562_006609 [Nyssa sinensis]
MVVAGEIKRTETSKHDTLGVHDSHGRCRADQSTRRGMGRRPVCRGEKLNGSGQARAASCSGKKPDKRVEGREACTDGCLVQAERASDGDQVEATAQVEGKANRTLEVVEKEVADEGLIEEDGADVREGGCLAEAHCQSSDDVGIYKG